MKTIFNNLLNEKDLSFSEASLLVENIFNSNISNIQLSSILTLLQKKKNLLTKYTHLLIT